MQKKKVPFTVKRAIRPTKSGTTKNSIQEENPQSPLYIENILKEVEIQERSASDRKVYIVSADDNMSPSTNSTSESAIDFDRYIYEIHQSRHDNQNMIYDPTNSLRLISGIASEREFGSEDYELLLQLDEAHKIQTQTVGLEESKINSFKFWKVNNIPKSEFGEERLHKCSICLHNIRPGQIARELPCNHIFHKGCIDKWLKSDCRCPLDNINMKDAV